MQSHYSSQPARSGNLSLEAEFARITSRRRSGRTKSWLARSAEALLKFLTGQQSMSIRVKVLANGATEWIVYDPATQQRYVFDSQQAVRAWLEQRYYR